MYKLYSIFFNEQSKNKWKIRVVESKLLDINFKKTFMYIDKYKASDRFELFRWKNEEYAWEIILFYFTSFG